MFFFNDTATTEIYTLSLHDALPISREPLLNGAAAIREAADPARAVVRIEVMPDERRRLAAAVDKATRDRAAVPVAVLEHGLYEARGAAGVGPEAVQPLHDRPAVIKPSL